MPATLPAPVSTSASVALRSRSQRWAPLLPLLAALLAYSNVLDAGLVWDDRSLITEQAVVQQLAPVSTYFSRMFWSDTLSVSRGYYRPITTLSYALDQQVWGGAPAGFHLTNLVLHLLAVGLLYRLCRTAGAGPAGASVAAALFGVFPRLTESVAWVSGRTDVLASVFVISALGLYAGHARPTARAWGAAALLLLGLFCKEVTAAGVVGVAVLELARLRRGEHRWTRSLALLAPSLLACAVYAGLRLNAAQVDVRAVESGLVAGLTTSERAAAALAALGHYGLMLLDPLRPRLQIGTLGEHPWPLVLLGALWLSGVLTVLYRRRRAFSELQWGAALTAAVSLLLVLHLVPIGLHTLASDRFLYLPVAMLAVVVAAPVDRILHARTRLAGALAAVTLVAFALATYLRNRDWASESRLWSATARTAGPDDPFVQQQLAALYMEAHRYEDALPHLQRSVETARRTAGLKAYNNLALCLTKLGRHPEAIALFQEMVRKQPDYVRGRLNLAMTYARALRFDEARAELARYGALAPQAPLLAELQQLLARAQAQSAQLPPPSAAEPAQVAIARAQLFQELGAPFEAGRAWEAVTRAPDATPAQRLQATGHLVFEGSVPVAQRALAELRRSQPGAEQLEAFEHELRARAQAVDPP